MLLTSFRIRSHLLSGAGLLGLLVFGSVDRAMAACAPSVPGAGATVTCTGSDTTGISGNAANVTVNMDATTNIATTGIAAIDLGTGAAVNAASSAVISSTGAPTITVDGGTVTSFANSNISSTTGPAVQFTGTAGTALTVTASGTLSGGAGIAVDFGSSNAVVSLTPTHNFVGNVVAGAGATDTLRLSSSSNGNFNVSDIGTKYLGFDLFQKNGTSIWTLTGTGNQAWTVTNGTLIGTVGNLNSNITNNSNVAFNNTTGTYSSVISGTGAVTKSGTGTLTMSGANTYVGATSLTGGGLVVNGSLTSAVTTSAGTRLGGSGTVASIINNGTLAPGNSIGTMNVNGAVTFNSGSTYEVEVDAGGASDRTVATGAITINNGSAVSVLAAAGSYAASTNYTILQGASRAGTFTGGITSNLAFLDPSLSYTATSVILTMTRNTSDFSTVAQDASQVRVADAVQQLGSGSDLYNAFSGLGTSDARQALDTLSGEHNTGLNAAAVQTASAVNTIISNRVQSLMRQNATGNKFALHMIGNDDESVPDLDKQAYAMLEPSAARFANIAKGAKNIWSEVFGSFGKSDSRGTAPSQNRESGGFLVGADMALSKTTQLGIFGGMEDGEIYTDTQFANSDVEGWHGGLYMNHLLSPQWRLSGGLSGTYRDIDTTRHIVFAGFSDTAKGDTDGYSASAFIEAGYALEWGGVALEPFAGVSLTHSAINGYHETDGGSANLDVDDNRSTVPAHTLGIRAGKNISLSDETDINLHGKLGWEHRYGNLSDSSALRFQGGTTAFTVSGTQAARDVATFGAGADVGFNATTRAYLGYEGSYAADERNHGVSVGVKVSF